MKFLSLGKRTEEEKESHIKKHIFRKTQIRGTCCRKERHIGVKRTYWYCDDCGEFYSDERCFDFVPSLSQFLPLNILITASQTEHGVL